MKQTLQKSSHWIMASLFFGLVGSPNVGPSVGPSIGPSVARASGDFHPSFACGDLSKKDLLRKIEKRQDKILKKLKLTKDQKEQIQKIREEHSELIFAQLQKVRGAHTEIVGAIERNAPNEVIRERVTHLDNERRALLSTQLELMLATRDLLTPDQKQRAAHAIRERLRDDCD